MNDVEREAGVVSTRPSTEKSDEVRASERRTCLIWVWISLAIVAVVIIVYLSLLSLLPEQWPESNYPRADDK